MPAWPRLLAESPLQNRDCIVWLGFPLFLPFNSFRPNFHNFPQEKAGKRMKLPTPETWETQVALKGNKASTWEQLLGKKVNYHNAFLFFIVL